VMALEEADVRLDEEAEADLSAERVR
jgi:hypothetical protein